MLAPPVEHASFEPFPRDSTRIYRTSMAMFRGKSVARGAFLSEGWVMTNKPARVSVVVFPESDPSIFYGVFDTLWAAGRLWNSLQGLPEGQPMFEPQLVAVEKTPLRLVTGVTILPDIAIADVQKTETVV